MSIFRKVSRRAPLLVLLILILAGTVAKGAGWRYQTDDQGTAQWYWVPYSSADNDKDPDHHPTFRETAYGTSWNYSLTLGWTARPLWLYDGDTKILFRQHLEAGQPQDIKQLTLWTRTHYPDLRICMEPSALDVLTRNGIDEILVQNGADSSEMAATLYVVDNLVQMIERTGLAPEEISEVWLGDPEGPTIVPISGDARQLSAGGDGAAEIPGEPS